LRSNAGIESNCLYKPLQEPGTTRPPSHRISIPHPLFGKGHSKTHVKFW
jgi:hypothetical protein